MGTFFLIIIAFIAGISFGFTVGYSLAMRETTSKLVGLKRPVIAKIVIGMGSAALVGALATALHTWHFTKIALRTNGTVIEMRQHTDKDSGDVSHAPTFRFQDAAGAQHTVSSSMYSSPPEFAVGDTVSVLYRGDDPRKARIDSYWQVWGLPSLLGILGSIALPIGVIVLLWPKIIGLFRGQPANAQVV